jgi:hypothetical protein
VDLERLGRLCARLVLGRTVGAGHFLTPLLVQVGAPACGIVDQAVGAIMAQQRCSAEQAFAVLRATSQNRNIKLRTVAADIVGSLQQNAPHDGHVDGTGPAAL